MVAGLSPVSGYVIVVSIALVTAFGVPATSVDVAPKAGSVPQINEFRVLLEPPFINVISCTEVVVSDEVPFEIIAGMRTYTFDITFALVTPEALVASNA